MNIEDIDPLKAYKFTVEIDGEKIGLMKVEGLTNKGPGFITLTKGFTSAGTKLRDWGNDVYMADPLTKDVKITIDGRLVMEFKECKPHYLYFSNLDAGEASNYIFTESLEVSFKRVLLNW